MKQETLQYPGTGVLFGAPSMSNKNKGTGLYNSAVLLFNGKQLICQHKSLLPTYDVFDEARYFDPASEIHCVSLKKNEMQCWVYQYMRTPGTMMSYGLKD